MANMKRKQLALPWILLVISCVVAAVVIVTVLLWKPSKYVNSFQSCKDAGGAILESYPEQCLLNGRTFTNDAQSVDNQPDDYVGLTEQDALVKADTENKSARVVDRDGESLPVTMDYMPGRLNLSVKDSKVYKVQVEGEEN